VVVTTTVGVGAAVRLARRPAPVPTAAKKPELQGRRTAAAPPRELSAPGGERATREDPPSDAPAVGAPAGREASNDEGPGREAVRTAPARAARAEASAARAKLAARGTTAPAPSQRAAAAPAPAAASERACAPAASGPEPAARRPESTVADEARLVDDGVRALREGQAACALSLLDTHARFYPEGVLAEERDAERALALAELGRVAEARAAAAAFLRKHPASPLGVRLRQRIPGIDGAGEEPPR
jgi:hypothetical protein